MGIMSWSFTCSMIWVERWLLVLLILMKLLTITSLFKLSFHKIKIVTNKNEIYYKYEKKIKVYIKRIFKFAGQINWNNYYEWNIFFTLGYPRKQLIRFQGARVRFMVSNATFNNISVILWQSVLLVEETGVPGKNHQPATSHRVQDNEH